MKDKSRFMSSVIVSLLAGFIYYWFGQDINENVQSSLKAVLSSNDINESTEHYMPSDGLPFTSVFEKSGVKSKQKKSKFYVKKRNTIEFKNKGVTAPNEELFSNLISNRPAKFVKPVPDKKVDFTAELDLLIKNNETIMGIKPVKELSSLLNKSNNEVAETRSNELKSKKLNKNFKQTQIKAYYYRKGNAEYKGSGFEYNYVTGQSSPESGSNSKGIISSSTKNECKNYNYQVTYKKKTKVINGQTVEIITPKVKKVKVKNVNSNDNDVLEINIEDSENQNSCN